MPGFFITVEDLHYREAIKEYMRLLGKGIAETLREQARLLAERLAKLTPPKSKSQGNTAVERDINRVYLRNNWFEEVFTFTKQTMQDRIKNLVLAKNQGDLQAVFRNSPKLNMLRIESFDPARHSAARQNGKVNYHHPYSYPLSEQTKIKAYITLKKKAVGFAKSGWALCFDLLGGNSPSWLRKGGTGNVDDKSAIADNPYITITNEVDYFSRLDSKANIVPRALEGRADNMVASAKRALARAAKEARLN